MSNFRKRRAAVMAVVIAMLAIAIPVAQPVQAAAPAGAGDLAPALAAVSFNDTSLPPVLQDGGNSIEASISTIQTAPVIEEGNGYQVIEVERSSIERIVEDNEPTAAAQTNNSARAVDETVELVVITTPRALRDLDLPDWFTVAMLQEEGYSSWADVSDADLDVAFTPHYTFLPAVEQIDEARTAQQNSGQRGGLCHSRRKTGSVDINERLDLRKISDQGTNFPRTASGASGSMGMGIDGEITLVGKVNYQYKKPNSWCGAVLGVVTLGGAGLVVGAGLAEIPHDFSINDSNFHIDAVVDGSLSAKAQARVEREIFKKTWELWDYTQKWNIYAGIQVHAKVVVGIDVTLRFEASVAVEAEAAFDVKGEAGLSYECSGSSCNKTREFAEWQAGSSQTPEIAMQLTQDIRLTPAIDFYIKADVMLGTEAGSSRRTTFMGGRIGLVAQMPIRAYFTAGNLCSDSDGDGTRERVQTFLFDVTAEVFAYWSVSVFGHDTLGFFNLRVPNGWARKQIKEAGEIVVGNTRNPAYLWEKNLYFKDMSSENRNSAIEAVVGRGGTFYDRRVQAGGAGKEYNGIELFGPRRCYPFRTPATYEIDWGDGSPRQFVTTENLGFIPHTWSPAGRNQEYTVRTRIVKDDAGRSFKPRWTTKKVIAGDIAPDTPVNLRSEVYSSSTTELLWEAPASQFPIVGYQVNRNGIHLETVDARSYLDKSANGRPSYEVFAVNSLGARSVVPATVRSNLLRPPTVPGNVRAFRYSSTSGEIMWDRSTDNGSVANYEVSYWVSGAAPSNPRGIPIVKVEGTSFSISNLVPNVPYSFAVLAVDNEGNRSAPGGVTLTSSTPPSNPPTSSGAPSTPGNIKAHRYSSSSGEIIWTRSVDPEGDAVTYRVVRDGSVINNNLDGLSDYSSGMATKSYEYKIYAVDRDGNESAPAVVTLDLRSASTTPPPANPPPASDAPSTPDNIRAHRYSSSSGEVMWDRSTDPEGGVVLYRVVRDGSVINNKLDGLSDYSSGMATKSYEYKIYAIDSDGNESAPAVVTLDLTS